LGSREDRGHRSHPQADAERRRDSGVACWESSIGDLTEIAESTPRAAVVEAFIRIETELVQILTTAGLLADTRPMGARQLALMALDNDLITAESANAIEGLAVMRNLAVHGGDDGQLDQQRALEYLHLAEAVLFALRSKA